MVRRASLTLAVLLFMRPALAQSGTDLELTWQAPPGCPSEADVREQINSLLQAPTGQPVQAEGHVTQAGDGYHLDLTLRDGELVGTREFDGDSCQEVTGAAAVAIALLLRSSDDGMDGTSSGEAARDATPSTKATDSASETTGESKSDLKEDPLEVVLLAPSLGAGLTLFSAPSLALGGGLALEPGRWRFALTGAWHADITLPVAEIPGTSVSASRQTISAAGCHFLVTGVVELAPCLTVSLQILNAWGIGTDITPSQASTAWLALGPTSFSRLRLGPTFALTTTLGLDVETARPRLVIEGLGTVEQMGPVEILVGMGTEWIF